MSSSDSIEPTLGRHLLVEFYGCRFEVLDDLPLLREELLEAARVAGASVLGDHFHRFAPHGVSGTVIISESHLSIHTWPELGYAAVDLFTCGPNVDPQRCKELLERRLHATSCSVLDLRRGDMDKVRAAQALKNQVSRGQKHPALYTYDEAFVRRFIATEVQSPTRAGARALVREVGEQIYQFPLFTEELCSMLVDEAEHAGSWRTIREKTEAAHSALTGVSDVYEPDTILPFDHMPGLETVYARVIENHVRPIVEGLWTTYRLQKWDPPAVRKYEPHVVSGMELHYDAETVGMIGYLSRDFEGGGTYFPRWNLTIGSAENVQVGSVLVYPGGISHEHSAHKITAGVRYTLANSFY